MMRTRTRRRRRTGSDRASIRINVPATGPLIPCHPLLLWNAHLVPIVSCNHEVANAANLCDTSYGPHPLSHH